MVENFVLIHHLGPISTSTEEVSLPKSCLRWKTCLRTITFGFAESFRAVGLEETDLGVFTGAEAYQFLLEVVCGLHSPVVGETEVMGQFKELVQEAEESSLRRILGRILTDAKKVRASLLRDIGSRSYGSLLRKYLKDESEITVFGAGKLAQEILPWLKTAPQVNLVCRDLSKGHDVSKRFEFAQVNHISERKFGDVFIVAASISTAELRNLIRDYTKITKIIDLRDISSVDPLNLNIPTLTLQNLFSEINSSQLEVQAKVAEAKKSISKLSQKYFYSAELRPFGWEDLCG